jgi:hypothetical protein
MAAVDVSGFAQFSDGTSVPLFNDAMTEGTLSEIQTSASYTVTAQSLGTTPVIVTYCAKGFQYFSAQWA